MCRELTPEKRSEARARLSERRLLDSELRESALRDEVTTLEAKLAERDAAIRTAHFLLESYCNNTFDAQYGALILSKTLAALTPTTEEKSSG